MLLRAHAMRAAAAVQLALGDMCLFACSQESTVLHAVTLYAAVQLVLHVVLRCTALPLLGFCEPLCTSVVHV